MGTREFEAGDVMHTRKELVLGELTGLRGDNYSTDCRWKPNHPPNQLARLRSLTNKPSLPSVSRMGAPESGPALNGF